MNETGPGCKYCQQKNVIKYGKYKKTQYYFCKDCKLKFSNPHAIPKMQYSTSRIAEVLHMYYEGMRINEICRNFIQQYDENISDITAWNWINRFSRLAIVRASSYRPEVGNVWVAYEAVIHVSGRNIWLWDMVDTKTLFLVASHISDTRTVEDAQQLMKQAYERTNRLPVVIYTDKLRACLDGIKLIFGGGAKHTQGVPFDVKYNAKLIERFRWTVEDRVKAMCGLRTIKSARLLTDGWLVHYNYFKPRTSLRGRTPAGMAGIKFPFRNWKEVCEQPYHVTARIPIIKSR